MDKLTSYCTYWNFDAEDALSKRVGIPIHPTTLVEKRMLHSRISKKEQRIEVFEDFFGNKQIYINGKYQVGLNHSKTEPFFGDDSHQIYVDVIRFHRNKTEDCRVLIIGGGDLGLASLLLENQVKEITQYELDEEVVEVCSEFIPEITLPALKNKKVNIKYCDGFEEIKNTKENSFDVVIGDLTAEGAELFNETKNLESVKRICKKEGIVITHFAEGRIDLNKIHFHFNSQTQPNFACIIELSYDENCVWSPRELKFQKKNIKLTKLNGDKQMKSEIKAFFTGQRDRRERETRKIYSNEKVFEINGENILVSLTVDIYQEIEYKINHSCDFSDLPTSDPAKLSKILHWIMDGQSYGQPKQERKEANPTPSWTGGKPHHIKNFYPNAWATLHNEDENGEKREKILRSFFEMDCIEYDNDKIFHYDGDVNFIKTMYNISPNT